MLLQKVAAWVCLSFLESQEHANLKLSKGGLALFGAQKTHLYNNQTTPFLFDMLKRTTIPIGVDDISEKAQDTWEELVINA